MSCAPFLLSDLAAVVSSKLPAGVGRLVISGVASLSSAQQGDLSFCLSNKYKQDLSSTRASVVLISASMLAHVPDNVTAWVVDNPELAFAKIAQLFVAPIPEPGCHATAVCATTASIHPSASVGAGCYIGEGAVIGPNVVLEPHCVVGAAATLAEGVFLHARVTINHGVVLHKRVEIHSGAVIGADGFGLSFDAGSWQKIPQLGSVILHDDVEIGANTTVDRGALDDTVIHQGVKIDNQVQVGHNVSIGAHTVIAGCVAIGGSTRIGAYCLIGGDTVFAGHLQVADGVKLAGRSSVMSSIKKPGSYGSGIVALRESKAWLRMNAHVAKLESWVKRIKALEEKAHEPEHN